MIEIYGKYNNALVYADSLEDAARAQIQELCGQAFAADSRIRIMPDVHAGAGCTVGTTMTITDRVVPNLVGVDIGCGMETVILEQRRLELPKLDKVIRERIPSGFDVRDKAHPLAAEIDLDRLRWKKGINHDRAYRSIGTLGGGNHFIEVDRDEAGRLYLVVHSGSRHLGLEIAKAYQMAGFEQQNEPTAQEKEALVQRYRTEGRHKELQGALKKLKSESKRTGSLALAYVSGTLFEDYLHDMALVQQFAALNRQAMVSEIVKGMKLDIADQFTTVHNYIDMEARILRKGAVSAREGERLLIPINMRDGSLICRGKGNAEWNQSAPHGAGRLMSRGQARQSFTVSEYKKQMADIYTTSVGPDTLDECPMAYKPMENILAQIGPTVEVTETIRPVYNYKAGADAPERER